MEGYTAENAPIRVRPEIHKRAKTLAAKRGVTLNSVAQIALERYLEVAEEGGTNEIPKPGETSGSVALHTDSNPISDRERRSHDQITHVYRYGARSTQRALETNLDEFVLVTDERLANERMRRNLDAIVALLLRAETEEPRNQAAKDEIIADLQRLRAEFDPRPSGKHGGRGGNKAAG